MHHRTRMPSEFKTLFGSHVAFACEADEIVYPGSIARTPCTNADPYLNALLVRYCEEAVTQRRKRSTTWQLKVENAIIPLLPHGQARIGKVAAELGVSRRTLGRRLAWEGLSFRKVLDNLRFDLAKRYLPICRSPRSRGFSATARPAHSIMRSNAGLGARPSDGPMAVLK